MNHTATIESAPLDRKHGHAGIRYQAECPYCGKLRDSMDRGALTAWIQRHADVVHHEKIHKIQARRCVTRTEKNESVVKAI